MAKRIQQQVIWLLIAAAAVCGLCFPAAAQAYPSAVSVKAILPESQVGDVSYFDLRLDPGAEETIQMRIGNAEDKPVVASIELNPATTGINGTIVYNQTDTLDESLLIPIGDIASLRESTVEIPAHSTVLVDIDLRMPEETVDGVILGGLRVTADYPENLRESPESGQGIQIKNRFAYVIGLKVSQNDTAVSPDFHLKSITPGLVNYTSAVSINIQNSEAAIAKDMPFSAKIFQKGSNVPIREMSKDHAEMAPNSNCDYVVDWNRMEIRPGSYRLLVTMTHEDRTWEWDEEFIVAASEAGPINDEALGLEKGASGIPVWGYLLGIMLLIVIVLLLFLLVKLRDRKKEAS